ncbi:MAG: PQQ-dependent sugar dehydrogenase [Thiotrichales bacterium]
MTRAFRLGQILIALIFFGLYGLPWSAVSVHAAPLPSAEGFEKTTLVTGLANAVDFEFAPDGRVFILNRYGKVLIYKPASQTVVEALELAVFHESEAGLIGIAFDPNFALNRVVYLHYSPLNVSENRLSSFTVQGDAIDPASEKVILRIPTDRDGPSHDAGALKFDTLGNLLIGTGDAAEHSLYAAVDEDVKNRSAEKSSSNTNDLRGKILRIKPNPVAGTYAIPPGNLFPDGIGGRAEIYIMGARNPYKFGIDPVTNWLFWSDIGPDANFASAEGPEGQDEINLSKTAGNYGWPYFLADNARYQIRGVYLNPAAPRNTSRWNTGATTLPAAKPAWITQFHQSFMGGPVFRANPALVDPKKIPDEFDQHLFYWDFNQSVLRYAGFDAQGALVRDERLAKSLINSGTVQGLIDVEIGPDGHLYLLEYGTGCCDIFTGNGKLHRLDYTGTTGGGARNLAVGKAVTVSSVESGTEQALIENLSGENAVDGDPDTRWSSAFSAPQSIQVDLGERTAIDRVRIQWGYTYAKQYRVETSDDLQSWTLHLSETAGNGGVDEVGLGNVKARFVRVTATENAFEWGVSVRELEIWSPAPVDNYANAAFIGKHYQGSGTCSLCHNNLKDSAGNDLSLVNAWSSNMMANSARDPYWRAKVAAEIKRNPQLESEINDKCSRCHAPMANDTIRKDGGPMSILGAGMLNPSSPHFDLAMDGVSCTVCHQIEDTGLLGTEVSNSGNFSVRAYPDTPQEKANRPAFGQYADPLVEDMKNGANFTPQLGAHMSESAMCATCHDLKTPFVDANGALASSTYASEFPEQMVYTEWLNSRFSDPVSGQTCQDCHMAKVGEAVKIASVPSHSPARNGFARHNMTGANTTMLAILRDHRSELGVLANGFDAEIQRTQAFLKTAATLEILDATLANGELTTTLKLTNQSGHKLPSAYPSRRVFIHLTITDSQGQVVFESGKPNPDGSIAGNASDLDPATFEPHYTEITAADQVQIYESIMADTDGAVTHTLLRAATYVKDNRLTPPGSTKLRAPQDIRVIGGAANDADFDDGSDTIRYRVAVGNRENLTVTARLIYQPLAFGHLQDLFKDQDVNEVARFKVMFDAAPHKFESLVEAWQQVSMAGSTRGGGGAGMGIEVIGLLALLHRYTRRTKTDRFSRSPRPRTRRQR